MAEISIWSPINQQDFWLPGVFFTGKELRSWSHHWCDYSQMEETQNNCQSPSDWDSMQDLTSWSFNEHENGEESAQNYTGGSCQWSQGSWDHSHQESNW